MQLNFTTRDKIKQSMLVTAKPSWQSGVYSRVVFNKSTRVAAYFGVSTLIGMCDALSILFVEFVNRFTSYFDIDKKL